MNFKEEFSVRTKEVGQVIEDYLPSVEGFQSTVLEAMDYSVRAGGKRLRPMLMEETYRLFGGTGKEIFPFMAAIEMIHTSSLIHDDLPCMDNDTLRRGMPTAWVKFGYDMAVLAGDGLLIYAMETAAKALPFSDRPDRIARCMGLMAEKTGIFGMIGGQTVDVELAGKPVPKDKLDFIYRLKTGALLEASMMIGAILGGAEEDSLKQVERIASMVGMAFQIQDDILDLTSNDKVLGKSVLSDEKNHKTTYVSINGMTKAKQDVEIISEEAIMCLHELPGENKFLEELIRMLVNREK
ncbi:polyprenyl synthetase family protein [Clostridium sp. HBUAS56010]|uniref:polyprenyl synthetase family protein n=1 Tax=Clostridium sp. HBUAS56010 TaxID=2571127 RepID=UPI0011778C20|nr:farnesyl diphosphate synthase [Clostridium sp. HBUAS56010]